MQARFTHEATQSLMHELSYTSVEHWAVLATRRLTSVNYSMRPHQQLKPQLTGADWCWHLVSLCNRSFSNSAADAGYSMRQQRLFYSEFADELTVLFKGGSGGSRMHELLYWYNQ